MLKLVLIVDTGLKPMSRPRKRPVVPLPVVFNRPVIEPSWKQVPFFTAENKDDRHYNLHSA